MRWFGTIRSRLSGKVLSVVWLLVVLSALCGCSTVQPELTPEERLYNEQLKLQGNAKPRAPSSGSNPNALETVGKLLSEFSQVFVYALAGSHGDTDHHQ
jgi:predicted component of type VI protein secretion system